MIKRIGIALATTLFALLTFAAAPASATPLTAHVWDTLDYQGALVNLGPTAGQCVAVPLAGADSAVQGSDNVQTTTFYELSDPTCTTAIDTMPGGQVSEIRDIGASTGNAAAEAAFYIMQ